MYLPYHKHMSNQEHICIAITKSNMGGAQKYVLTLADELQKRGKKVTVLAGGHGLLFEELSKRDIPYIVLSQSQRDISFIKEIKLLIELYKVLRQINPTILHLNSSKLGVIGTLIGRLLRIKKIFFTAHGWAFNEKRPTWQKRIFYFLYWITILCSTKTICVSEMTKNQISFLPFIKNKLVTIYNGIQSPDFYSKEEARKQLKENFNFLDLEKKWIVILAELHYTKGHDIVCEAINSITQSLEHYQIVCIGSGEQESRLKALIHYKNLEKYMFFTGFVSDASRYLKAFEFLILPSRTEALPLTVLEAGLAKVPVLASNVGGIPEVIEHSVTGFLFEKENEKELQEQIMHIIVLSEDQKQSITNRLEEKINTHFSITQMIENTITEYTNL